MKLSFHLLLLLLSLRLRPFLSDKVVVEEVLVRVASSSSSTTSQNVSFEFCLNEESTSAHQIGKVK